MVVNMLDIDNKEIIDLIETGVECEYLDFKLEEYKSHNHDELIKDIMAFANAHNKQKKYIIVGMSKEKGKTTFQSISPITDDTNYQIIIDKYLEPALTFSYVPFDYKGNQLGVFVIDSNNYENRLFRFKKNYQRGKDILYKEGESRIRKGSATTILSLYDLEKIYKPDERNSNLIIQVYKDDEITPVFDFYNFDDIYIDIIHNKEKQIKEMLQKIETIEISKTEESEIQVEKSTNELEISDSNKINMTPGLEELVNNIRLFDQEKFVKDAEIDKSKKDMISLYCEIEDIEIEDEFFDIGNLKIYEKLVFDGGFPYSKQLIKGTPDEEQKYELINKLNDEIHEFVYVKDYLVSIKGISYLKLLISNIGDLKDDDIIISLLIPKGCLCQKDKLVCDNEYGSKLFIELYGEHLQMNATPEIDIYEKPVVNSSDMSTSIPYINPLSYSDVFGYDSRPSEESIIYEAKDIIDEIYCYDYLVGKEFDILKFELSKLMHNRKTFFPEVIVFENIPNEIHYEIKSKEMKNAVTGSLKVKQ